MENEIINDILNGNPKGFSYFISEYRNMAYTIAFRIVNNREDAEEIVQDSFLRAYRSLHKFRKDSKFSTWFYRIVVNRALSVRAVKKEIPPSDLQNIQDADIELTASVYSELVKQDRQKYINKALDSLEKEDRLLITLYYLEENSVEEISLITGIRQENIKMKLSRARKKMFFVLGKILNEDFKSIL